MVFVMCQCLARWVCTVDNDCVCRLSILEGDIRRFIVFQCRFCWYKGFIVGLYFREEFLGYTAEETTKHFDQDQAHKEDEVNHAEIRTQAFGHHLTNLFNKDKVFKCSGLQQKL